MFKKFFLIAAAAISANFVVANMAYAEKQATVDASEVVSRVVKSGVFEGRNKHITTGGVLANCHTDGPIAGKVVVLTHATVLHAMLTGSLSIERATELGMVTYSGIDAFSIQQVLEVSLHTRA